MESTYIIVMEKDMANNKILKELSTIKINTNSNCIFSTFVDCNTNEVILTLTTDKNLVDWEYSAVYDYYDIEIFNNHVKKIIENDLNFNPCWDLFFDYKDDDHYLETKINELLELHSSELNDVYLEIEKNKADYN